MSLSLPETLPELKRLNGELVAKLQSGTLDGQDRVALKQQLVQVMDRIEHVRASTPSPPPHSNQTTSLEIVVLRHAERVDETPERHAWAQQCGDRWWDPPLTDEGKRQSREAGEALLREHQSRPFACVLASPCLRTTQTAAELAAVLGLTVRCSPGLAECAAAVSQFGIDAFRPESRGATRKGRAVAPPRFLTESEMMPLCAEGTRFAPRDETFDDYLSCVERLAAEEQQAQQRAQQQEQRQAQQQAGGVPLSGRVLVVTHREGIRDLCDLAGSPHRRTGYCCAALFCFDNTAYAGGGKGGRVPVPGAWRLLSPPGERPGALDPAVAAATGVDSSSDATAHASSDTLLAELAAGRIDGDEFERRAPRAGIPAAVVTAALERVRSRQQQ